MKKIMPAKFRKLGAMAPREIFVLGMILLALAAFSATARANEASGGAYATWCFAGVMAGQVGTRVAREKYGKAVSGATELAVSAAGCAAADAGIYSLTDHPDEAPSEVELNQDQPVENQE
jgi:hypothetical protein